MRITTHSLRTQVLALLATGSLASTGCGGSVENGGTHSGGGGSAATGGSGGTGTGGSATGGYGAGGIGGVGTGGVSTGGYGAGGVGATGGTGGFGTGGFAGSGSGGMAGAGGAGGLIIKGNMSCGCSSWESCWNQGEVPEAPGAPPPGAGCPDPGYVDGTNYPYCGGTVFFSAVTPDGNLCCYTTTHCITGRPLVVDGEVRTAGAVARADWSRSIDFSLAELDAPTRGELAREWLDDARFEHASVAAFAKLTLELLALGAPPELVRGAQESALDEIRHAELCFGVASRLAGSQVGPGPLPVQGAVGEPNLEELARSTFVEGCVNETVAALVAAAQARATRSCVLRKTLERIAADESRHAALGWSVVRWALERGGAGVRSAIERAFAGILAEERQAAPLNPNPLRRAFGRLDADEMSRIRSEALRDVVAPCVEALLGSRAERAA